MESIGTLAGGIDHDLNNVLAPVLMAVQLFRAKMTDESDQEHAGFASLDECAAFIARVQEAVPIQSPDQPTLLFMTCLSLSPIRILLSVW